MLKIKRKQYFSIVVAIVAMAIPSLSLISNQIDKAPNVSAAEEATPVEDLNPIYYNKGSNKDLIVSFNTSSGSESLVSATLEGAEFGSCIKITNLGKLTIKASCLELLEGNQSYKLVIKDNSVTTKYDLIVRSTTIISCTETPNAPLCQSITDTANNNENNTDTNNNTNNTGTENNNSATDTTNTANQNSNKESNTTVTKKYTFEEGELAFDDDENLIIEGSGDSDKFVALYINDKVVDKSNYTLASGSTIITLKSNYLDTLENGEYAIAMEWQDGRADGILTVNNGKYSIENVKTEAEEEKEEENIEVPKTSGITPDTGVITNSNEGITGNTPFIIIVTILLSSGIIFMIHRNGKKVSFTKH